MTGDDAGLKELEALKARLAAVSAESDAIERLLESARLKLVRVEDAMEVRSTAAAVREASSGKDLEKLRRSRGGGGSDNK